MSDEAFVRLSSKNGEAEVYHTDRECRVLKGPVREPFVGELDKLRPCPHCTGSIDGQDRQDFSHQKALREAGGVGWDGAAAQDGDA